LATRNLGATALKAYPAPRGPVNGPCGMGSLGDAETLVATYELGRTYLVIRCSRASLASAQPRWFQKVCHDICCTCGGPLMDLIARSQPSAASRCLTPRSLRTPARNNAADTTRLKRAMHSTCKVVSATIINSYARCPPNTWPCHNIRWSSPMPRAGITNCAHRQPAACPALLRSFLRKLASACSFLPDLRRH